MAKGNGLLTNMNVDYVIVFRYSPKEKASAQNRFEALVHKLAQVGLATEARNGENNSILVFVKVASNDHMFGEIYRSRVKDWIHGVRSSEPARDTKLSLEEDPLTDAERLRIIYQLITNDEKEGGAGIRPKKAPWENVESIFALQNRAYNKQWIQKWSTEYQLKPEDLDEIRDHLGEKVAYYFAFEQSYFTFLVVPSVFGLIAWLFLGSFSPVYAVFSCLWCVVFVEWWKHQESDLAIRWGVHGVSSIENKRHGFHPTKEVEDPATGETQLIFPVGERLKRQLLQLPFVILAISALGSLIILCFAIEIFIGEIYDGPGKSYLTFLPTVILTTCLPLLTGALTDVAKRLNKFENYETDSQYDRSLTGKLFVLDFITSYMPLFLTAFLYVPFGSILIPKLDFFNVVTKPLLAKTNNSATTDALKSILPKPALTHTIKPERLTNQVKYFAVTASIINFCTEVIVPYVKRAGFGKIKEFRASHSRAVSGSATPSSPTSPVAFTLEDSPDEKEFLRRVRAEAELPAYDVYTDLREMVIQFGYLSLFSVVWPLVPVSFLVNNWFELRADAVKICVEMQRPTPWRADTIGPWLDALGFLTWLGSLTMAALTYMFASNGGSGPHGNPYDLKAWALLLSIFCSEHLYLFVHWVVGVAIAKIDSPGRQKERRDKYLTRERIFQENLKKVRRVGTFNDEMDGDDAGDMKITRETLEEDARKGSLKSASVEERFWTRQKGWRETSQVGKGLIEKAAAATAGGEKESKKEL